jgi:hypothetical protein
LNIILLSMHWSSKWSPSLRFAHQNPISTPPLPHTCYRPCSSHSSWFGHLKFLSPCVNFIFYFCFLLHTSSMKMSNCSRRTPHWTRPQWDQWCTGCVFTVLSLNTWSVCAFEHSLSHTHMHERPHTHTHTQRQALTHQTDWNWWWT